MGIAILKGLLMGVAFGAVLYKVGAVRYSRVMGMLTLTDTKIMKFTFVTVGVGAMIYGLADLTGLATPLNIIPRTMPWLGPAHLVGGVIFGIGLGFTGLCPGTCVTRTGGGSGAKKYTGIFAIAGLLVGILMYSATKGSLLSSGIISSNQQPLTLHGMLGLPYGVVAMAFGALMFTVAVVVDRATPELPTEAAQARKTPLDYLRGEWSFVAGGVAAAILIVLATVQNYYLGFSGSTLAFVGWVGHVIGMPLEVVPVVNENIAWRAALLVGLLPGGLLAHALSTQLKAAAVQPAEKVFDAKALAISFAGGFAAAYGAMVGGGCTTGAYLAAWPSLSLGSFAMGATFFATSMIVANLRRQLQVLDIKQAQAIGARVYD